MILISGKDSLCKLVLKCHICLFNKALCLRSLRLAINHSNFMLPKEDKTGTFELSLIVHLHDIWALKKAYIQINACSDSRGFLVLHCHQD